MENYIESLRSELTKTNEFVNTYADVDRYIDTGSVRCVMYMHALHFCINDQLRPWGATICVRARHHVDAGADALSQAVHGIVETAVCDAWFAYW